MDVHNHEQARLCLGQQSSVTTTGQYTAYFMDVNLQSLDFEIE